MKKILFVTSECVPFVKTGGLADVAGSLPKSLNGKDYDIRVVMPLYHAIKEKYTSQMEYLDSFWMDNRIYVGIKTLELDGIKYYFIDNEQYFSGLVPYYDMFQDLERFAYFDKAVLSSLPLIGFRPDIIHCHDWQASLVPVYLNTIFQGSDFFRGSRTIMTIHNIRFQGTWDVGHIRWVTALPDYVFEKGRLVSDLQDESIPRDQWTASMLRGGIVYSDYVTTVSNSYSYEIQTPAFGDGLDGILSYRRERLWGIVNGIDYDLWNPATDKKIENNYTARNITKNKGLNKICLQRELSLRTNEKTFTLGLVSRLTDQKGLDLIDRIMDRLCQMDINLVVLGSGDPHYENMFRYYQDKYPSKVSASICYSDDLAHEIYSSVDALLVPSAFEPCGLTQLISLRYGTIPIVHEIGGLKDTVKPYNEFEETGTGFSFADYNPEALFDRILAAYNLYHNKPDSWLKMQKRGMKEDWSWTNSSKIYKDLYNRM